MKKILALLLVLTVLLGCCACGAQTETTTETTTTETTKTETTTTETEKTEEAEETEETEELEVLHATVLTGNNVGFTPKDDTPMEAYYLENYGFDFEILPVDNTQDEAWNMFWASGGDADIIVPFSRKTELYTEGLVRPIEYEWFKEYMPRQYSGLLNVFGSDEAIINELSYNGEIYCVPYYTDTARVSWTAAFRNDWLEAVGLDVPTTVEEYGEVLRAFTEDDPDGNGIDDTYGASSSIDHGMWNLPAAFGTSSTLSFWVNDGEMTTNATADNYRDFLRQMAEWYANGWLDPEGITDDRGAIRSKWSVGKMGVYNDNPWWFEYARAESGPMQMLCEVQGLDFATACSFATGLEHVETGEPTILSLYSSICGQGAAHFGLNCPDEVVIRYMQMIDDNVVLYDGTEEDKEAQIHYYTRRIGTEGVHWERDENGYPYQIAGVTPEETQENGFNLFNIGLGLVNTDAFKGAADEFCIDLYADCLIQNKVYRDSNVVLPPVDGDMADTRTLISDYFYTCRTAFITGEMDIEADWDTYVATMEEYGLSDLIAYYAENL